MKKFIIFICFLSLFSVKAQNLPFVITEMMVNPEGNDTDREWLEVMNQSSQTLTIKTGRSGWRINDGENHLFNEPSLTISPNEIFVIVQDKNKFLGEHPDFKGKLISANFYLKNDSGKIQIFDEKKVLIGERTYSGSCSQEGYSMVFENALCRENKIKGGTPGVYPDQTKKDEVSKDQLKSPKTQEIKQEIKEPSTQPEKPSQTEVTLQPEESSKPKATLQSEKMPQLEETLQVKTITQPEITLQPENKNLKNESQESPSLTLYISEFLPNPEGNDKGKEFIEIYNYGDKEINLEDFVLEIGQKKIKLQGTIEANEYYLVNNKDYNFSIRNNGETLSIYFKERKIFSISYQGKAPEGKSFSKFEDNWYFSQPTPGKENKLVLEKTKSTKKLDEEEIKSEITTSSMANLSISAQEENKSNWKILGIFLLIILILSILSFIFL